MPSHVDCFHIIKLCLTRRVDSLYFGRPASYAKADTAFIPAMFMGQWFGTQTKQNRCLFLALTLRPILLLQVLVLSIARCWQRRTLGLTGAWHGI